MDRLTVFIHGLMGTLDFAEVLGAVGPAVAPDLLGYGEYRDADPEEVRLVRQVEHLERAVAAQVGGARVNLVGHSVGGAIALMYASRYPERVAAIVNVEGNFTLKDAFWSAAIARMTVAEVAEMLEGFRRAPGAWLARTGVAATPWTIGVAEAWFERQPASTVRATARSVVEVTGRREYLTMAEAVFERVPVHLVAGERSVGGWDIPKWARAKAASVTVMPGRGHIMMLEDAGEFGALVRRLVRGPGAGADRASYR